MTNDFEPSLSNPQFYERIKTLLKSVQTIASCGDYQKIHQIMLQELSHITGAQGGSIFAFDGAGLVLKHSLDPDHVPEGLSFPLRPQSPIKEAVEKKSPVLGVAQSGGEQSSGWKGYSDGSFIVLPLMDGHQNILCMVNLHNKKEPPFNDEDLELARRFVDICGHNLTQLTLTDYNQRKQAYYLDLLNTMPGGFALLSESGRLLDVNVAFAALLNLDPELCLDRNILEVGSSEQDERALIQKVLDTGEPQHLVKNIGSKRIALCYKAFKEPPHPRLIVGSMLLPD